MEPMIYSSSIHQGGRAVVATVIVLALIVVGVIYCIGIYNGLVTLRENVKASWSNIDVLLKQRHDEIPKLVETCKRYMQFEQETLERVMRARGAVLAASGSGNVAAVGAAERQLRSGIGQIYAVAERYPELKSDETFRHLQQRITGLEQAIADRRELYNDLVNLNNIRIGVFPDSIVAKRYGFKPAELLEFNAEEKRDVDVGALFKA
jgi:LemA protein